MSGLTACMEPSRKSSAVGVLIDQRQILFSALAHCTVVAARKVRNHQLSHCSVVRPCTETTCHDGLGGRFDVILPGIKAAHPDWAGPGVFIIYLPDADIVVICNSGFADVYKFELLLQR